MTAQQLDIFGSATVASTSCIGLAVILPRPCSACGSVTAVIGSSSRAIHAARLDCSNCGQFARWMPTEAYRLVSNIIDNFSRPEAPIVIRHSTGFVSGLSSHRV
jgi:hypothetical protein